MGKPPADLLRLFVALEKLEDAAALTSDSGFDSDTMRVLAAWSKSEQGWSAPSRRAPTLATPTAWRWLVDGWELDVAGIADASGLPYSVVRKKLDVLTGNRLIYPDGTMSQFAESSLRAHMGMRLRGKLGGKKQSLRRTDDPGSN